ncbi:CoA-binding protein [Anaerocellum diazotrophicum]|uniref:CoA-binding protein n=1 Tax=Caldicellulosiruptor diazotrophicus TaxID=2806205 RepID=A0ABM7NN15_9FIRM|nr:CoA-binding protein [Caldicellulosiruptor diazotrophicus]BCS81527.1 CoA-binding protein [Caldicellulosiruptor diazotrophicus]
MDAKAIALALSFKNWAVVGATPNKQKYGYMVYKKLKENGYKVFAINPLYDEIEGDKVYKTLLDLNQKIDCMSMIVSPEKGKSYIEQAIKIGVKYIWFQPGAESNELIKLCEKNSIVPIYNACVLVALNHKK